MTLICEFSNRIPKDIAPVVYCSVIAEGSEKEWDFLWDKCMKTNVAAEQVAIFTSLGCAKKPELIKVQLRHMFVFHFLNRIFIVHIEIPEVL